MCSHGSTKYRWANNGGKKQIAAYCVLCDAFLGWGSKIAGEKPVENTESRQLRLPRLEYKPVMVETPWHVIKAAPISPLRLINNLKKEDVPDAFTLDNQHMRRDWGDF